MNIIILVLVRDTVMMLLSVLDPSGTESRRKRRIIRFVCDFYAQPYLIDACSICVGYTILGT